MIIYVLTDGGAQPLKTDEGPAVLLDLLVLDLAHADGESQEPTHLRVAITADDADDLADLIAAAAADAAAEESI